MAGRPLSSAEGFGKYLKGKKATLKVKTSNNLANIPDGKVPLFDVGTTKVAKLIEPGDSVEFVSKGDINPSPSSRYTVSFKKHTYEIHFSNIVKPGKESVPSIKPQQLGVIGTFKSIDELAETIFVNLRKKENMFGLELFQYLNALLSLYSAKVRKECGYKSAKDVEITISENWGAWKGVLPLAEIGKDFGEMLGPMWVSGVKFKNTHEKRLKEIDFPAGGNYPLVDYFMTFASSDNKLPIKKKYSAKSKVGSVRGNTVKLTTVYKEIHDWGGRKTSTFVKKWKDHWVYEMVEMAHNLINVEKVKPISLVNQRLRAFAIKNKLSTSKETGNGFWNDVSKRHEEELKHFFSEFIYNNIYYVVFDIDTKTGLPKFTFDVDALKAAKVTLKEMSEQLGFDPKFGEKDM